MAGGIACRARIDERPRFSMDGQQLFFLIAALVVAVMILIWALVGRSGGGDSHAGHGHDAHGHDDHAAGHDHGPAAVEAPPAIIPTIGGAPDPTVHALSTADVDAQIAAQAAEAEASGKPRIAAAVGEPDDLRKIKGIGPKLNTLLGELGVARYDQIAAWTASDVAEIDPYLGTFKGRIERDSWIEQAGFLARGDIAGFEAKFGKL
jgi:predicted flap endonuclease-1-like 5' DNA nuclease